MKTSKFNRIAAANALGALASVPMATADDPHGRIGAFNASLAVEASFSDPLTTYATGFRDESGLDEALEFFAPEVVTSRRFEYAEFDSDEAFEADTDDERAINADFADVTYTSEKIDASTKNHGLQITVDYDQVAGQSNWEERYTQMLLQRIKRNSLIRALALLSAAATNTNKTWDTSAGKDPDQDMIADIIISRTKSGMGANRVGLGDTAAQKRALAHRAQNSAGGFASAGLTMEQLAGILGVDKAFVARSMYTTGADTKANVLANLVLMFNAQSGQSTEDPSNIKRFVSMGNGEEGGGRYQVYSQRVSAKRHVIAVGHYELTKITSTLGIRKFTVS